MGMTSSIEWTDATWNPVTGCSKISTGCLHCYAERMARRLQAMGHPNYANGFRVTTHENSLSLPLQWRRPRSVFVNSMGDLFHEEVPVDFIRKVFAVIEKANWHRFQILTKRSERLADLAPSLPWPGNLWIGVTVENEECAFRIDHLRAVNGAIRFLSLEPLLGPIPDMDLNGIDWVIVGGESGPGARRMDVTWARQAQLSCSRAGVPFFFKQWGGPHRKQAGRLLDGKQYDGMPSLTCSIDAEVSAQ